MLRFLLFSGLTCFSLLFTSCSDSSNGETKDSPGSNTAQNDTAKTPSVPVMRVIAETYEATDSTGKKTGWGYDLYLEGKRVIHQPIIPARSGNNAFASEADARKTGDYAAQKFMNTGRFPSITPEELDSLGIK